MEDQHKAFRSRPYSSVPIEKGEELYNLTETLVRLCIPNADDDFYKKNCILLSIYLHYHTKNKSDANSIIESEFVSYYKLQNKLSDQENAEMREVIPRIIATIRLYASDYLYYRYDNGISPYKKALMYDVYTRLSLWLVHYSCNSNTYENYDEKYIIKIAAIIRAHFPRVDTVLFTDELLASEAIFQKKKVSYLKATIAILVMFLAGVSIWFAVSWSNALQELSKTESDHAREIAALEWDVKDQTDKADDYWSRLKRAEGKAKDEYARGFENGFKTGVTEEHNYIVWYMNNNRKIREHETFFDAFGMPSELFFE